MSETISQLPAAATPTGTDIVPVTQGSSGAGTGTTRGATLNQILTASITGATAGAGLTTTPGNVGGTIFPASTLYAVELPVAQIGTSYTIQQSDWGKLLVLQNTTGAGNIAITLPQSATGGNFLGGWYVDLYNVGNGVVTITPTVSAINGVSSWSLQVGQTCRIVSAAGSYAVENHSPLFALPNNSLSTRIPSFPTAAIGGNARGTNAIDIQTYNVGSQLATQVASGNLSIAIGSRATASSTAGIAIGNVATSTSSNSIAVGNGTTASNASSLAFGNAVVASQPSSMAMGISVNAQGTNSIAFGRGTTANGDNSIAMGSSAGTGALGNGAISIGLSTAANNAGCISIGSTTANSVVSTNTNDVMIGNNCTSVAPGVVVIGNFGTANGAGSVMIGNTITDRGNIGAWVHGTGVSGIAQAEEYLLYASGGVNATATATVASGTVSSTGVVLHGSGYSQTPAVTSSGGSGTGATYTPVMANGTVTSITVVNHGSGYVTAPTMTIDPPILLFTSDLKATAGAFNLGAFPQNAVILYTIDLAITDGAGATLTYTVASSLAKTVGTTVTLGTGNPAPSAGPTLASLAVGGGPTLTADSTRGALQITIPAATASTDALVGVAKLRYVTTPL